MRTNTVLLKRMVFANIPNRYHKGKKNLGTTISLLMFKYFAQRAQEENAHQGPDLGVQND